MRLLKIVAAADSTPPLRSEIFNVPFTLLLLLLLLLLLPPPPPPLLLQLFEASVFVQRLPK
jgi:hypothetical protein